MASGLVRRTGGPLRGSRGGNDEVEAALRSFLNSHLERRSEVVRISGLHRTPAGLSRETWLFDVEIRSGGDRRVEQLVLRRDPPDGGGVLDTDRETELSVLRCLERGSIPSPRVLAADLDGTQLGRPGLVMYRDQGVCDYLILNGDRPVRERRALAEDFCSLLGRVHLQDWVAMGLGETLQDPGAEAAIVALDGWSTTLQRLGPGAYPELVAVERWLRSWAPRADRTVLVHGDFKPGNTLVDGTDITVLLDWETVHLGDPVEDLGWVTQPLRADEHLIEGVWSETDLIGHYRATTGITVDDEALRWWQLFASYKTAIIQLTGLGAYVRGTGDRLFREPAACLRVLVAAMQQDWLS